MARESKALTDLVKKYAGPSGRMSIREFAERSVDSATGYSPSSSLIGKIIRDQPFKVTPQLISAIAVGTGLKRSEVAAAAHAQYIGYDVSDLAQDAHDRSATVRAAHTADTDVSHLPKTHAWLADQEAGG